MKKVLLIIIMTVLLLTAGCSQKAMVERQLVVTTQPLLEGESYQIPGTQYSIKVLDVTERSYTNHLRAVIEIYENNLSVSRQAVSAKEAYQPNSLKDKPAYFKNLEIDLLAAGDKSAEFQIYRLVPV
jgi:hypothetical protein